MSLDIILLSATYTRMQPVNPYIVNFLGIMRSKYSIDAQNMTNYEWLNRNTTLRGKPFTVDRYPFQEAIINDEHPRMSVKKISQVGLTETQIRKELCMLTRKQGTNGIFALPDSDLQEKVASARVKPILQADHVFAPNPGDTRTKILIQLGTSFMHIMNSTEGAATSTPADILFQDEVDLTDPAMLSLFLSRLGDSDLDIRQRFSTPTHVGYGIDLSFTGSDQREFVCKCPSCNHYQIPDFEPQFLHIPGLRADLADIDEMSKWIDERTVHMLDLRNAYVRCERCHRPLDLDYGREWVARHPTRLDSRGYQVRCFTTARRTIPKIIDNLLEYKRQGFIRGWWNTVIGRAYTEANARLSKPQIEAVMKGEMAPGFDGKKLFVGIDIGQICHLTVMDEQLRFLFFLQIHVNNIVEYIKTFCQKNDVIGGTVDRLPYTPTAEAIWEASGKKIWPQEYAGKKPLTAVKDEFGEVTHYQVNRTKHLDRLADAIRAQNIEMYGYTDLKETVIEQLRDLVRDEKPEKDASYIKLTGQDHFYHAMANALGGTRILNYENFDPDRDERQIVTVISVRSPSSGSGLGVLGKSYKPQPLGMIGAR